MEQMSDEEKCGVVIFSFERGSGREREISNLPALSGNILEGYLNVSIKSSVWQMLNFVKKKIGRVVSFIGLGEV